MGWLRGTGVIALAVGTLGVVQAMAAEPVITMRNMTYEPAVLTAKVGDTIRFNNGDGISHEGSVPTKGFGVDLGAQKPGEETRLPLHRPGKFEGECVFHDHMLLTVTVTP